MNTIPPSSAYALKAYSPTHATPPGAVARLNSAAFRVSHIINQPDLALRGNAPRRTGNDRVTISRTASAMLQGTPAIRPVVTLPAPDNVKKGILVSIVA